RSLDLDRAITDIARSLVEIGGFGGSDVIAQVDPGTGMVERRAGHRAGEASAHVHVITLTGRQGLETRIELRPRADERAEAIGALEDLAEFLRPTMAMAIENARSMLVLEEKQQQLN